MGGGGVEPWRQRLQQGMPIGPGLGARHGTRAGQGSRGRGMWAAPGRGGGKGGGVDHVRLDTQPPGLVAARAWARVTSLTILRSYGNAQPTMHCAAAGPCCGGGDVPVWHRLCHCRRGPVEGTPEGRGAVAAQVRRPRGPAQEGAAWHGRLRGRRGPWHTRTMTHTNTRAHAHNMRTNARDCDEAGWRHACVFNACIRMRACIA